MIGDAEVSAATAALRRERLLKGPSVKLFEDSFATYVNANRAVAVNSGTTALILALRAIGVRRGARVVVPSATFAATATAVSTIGARPVFCDIDPARLTMDPNELKMVLDDDPEREIEAVVPVHLYGHPAQAAKLQRVAEAHGARVIADACQAAGARHQGWSVAKYADAAVWSFHPSKNLTVGGDGGMVTTNDDYVAEYVDGRRDCGRNPNDAAEIRTFGGTYRLASVLAAIGLTQLDRLEHGNEARRSAAARYDHGLRGVVRLPPAPTDEDVPVYQAYTIKAPNRTGLAQFLANAGIETGTRYRIPVHRQPIYRQKYGNRCKLPATDDLSANLLNLPIWPGITLEQQLEVIGRIQAFVEAAPKAVAT